jgi:hypothetical protein
VARKRTPLPPDRRKRRTREHVIGDLCVNHIERQALLCGFTVERYVHDYGIDLTLVTYTATGEVENGLVFVQAKATEKTRPLARKRAIAFRIERTDVVHWLSELLPVILVVYDASTDRAYWLHVQGSFATLSNFNVFRAKETITVHLPVSQVLTPTSVRHFATLRDAAYGKSPIS